jgi:hypothetical protein
MLNWIKRTMLTSTCAAYNGGKPQPISCNSATSKSPLLIVQHPFHELKQDV